MNAATPTNATPDAIAGPAGRPSTDSGTDSSPEDDAVAAGGPDRRETRTPSLAQVLECIEQLWPASLAESWDATGLVVGRPERPVLRVHFAVDPIQDVVDEAVGAGAQLLVTHHPLLLRGVNSVAATGFKGQVIHTLIEGGCALLTAHTNADSAVGGVSDVIAEVLGLQELTPLAPAAQGLPEEGIGRVGRLPQATTLADVAARVFSAMPAVAGGVRVAGERDGLVSTVAVCGGAGDSLFEQVRAAGADVYVTADLRHHPASEAREAARLTGGRPYLVEVSHFASEWLWLPVAAQALDDLLTDRGFTVEIAVSGLNTDPWDFVLTPGTSS